MQNLTPKGNPLCTNSGGGNTSRPLVFDLDGTLTASDLFLEQFLALAHNKPFVAALSLGRNFTRPERAKMVIARQAPPLDLAELPWRQEVLALLAAARAQGRPVILATAADRLVAEAVSAHLGGFDDILASDESINLKGPEKAAALVRRYGRKGFDYVGDSPADLAVWEAANTAWVVAPGRSLLASAQRVGTPLQTLGTAPAPGRYLQMLRPRHWLKNLILFVPLLAGHRLPETPEAIRLIFLFAAFCALASATYLFNDLLDLHDDRVHPKKRHRPLASGRISPWVALRLCGILVALAFSAGAMAGVLPLAWLAAYAVLGFLYCLYLKRWPGLDLIALAGFYLIRLEAGSAAVSILITPWLISFALAGFLTLALAKRASELRLRATAGDGGSRRRFYRTHHLQIINGVGVSMGFAACGILAAYAWSPGATLLYDKPHFLGIVAALFAIGNVRFWIRNSASGQGDDPLQGFLHDPVLLILAALSLGLAVYSSH